MNIIYARMPGYNWVSVPSDAVARELTKLGHKVTIIDTMDYIPIGEYDFVWSPYESVTELGDYISQKVFIPHFSHIEWLPPWRVFEDCDIEAYGLTKDNPEVRNVKNSRPYYINIGRIWKNAEVKTISNPIRIPMHEALLGKVKNIKLRFPSIDTTTLNKALKMYKVERIPNNILSISRMTEEKRFDLLLNIMNKIKTKVVWTIVGVGPQQKMIENRLNNKNVILDLKGSKWGWSKCYEMMKASIFLLGCGAMPAIEAGLLGAQPITIEGKASREIPDWDKFQEINFGGFCPIFKDNEVDKVVEKIEEQLSSPSILEEYSSVDKFMTGKTNVTSSKKNAENIIKLMKSYINE